ncbi:hypothetical protein ACO0LD_03120 [Undibacterium sp. Ji83W]|uniref:hypothetical protein n=1 Tax=Undibacterium sp. Ji83W TaxID=3413043 RepID=UPI003BF191D7
MLYHCFNAILVTPGRDQHQVEQLTIPLVLEPGYAADECLELRPGVFQDVF